MKSEELCLFEVDISVPVQQFRVEYTLVEKGGLPFVPEYLLRLLKISALLPSDIARFFGFTPKEVSSALLPFLQQGELTITDDGRVTLTQKGLRLFSGGDDVPVVKGRKEYRKSFTFDLLTYSFMEQKKYRLDSPKRSVVLSADSAVRAESVSSAEMAFQRHLAKIYKSGELCRYSDESDAPELYKVSQVRKDKDSYIRVVESYCLDLETMNYGFSEQEGLPELEAYISTRSQKLAELLGRSNLESLVAFADRLGDRHTLDLLGTGYLDLTRIAEVSTATFYSGQSAIDPIYGALQLTRNWDRVEKLLSKHTKRLAKEAASVAKVMTWLAPAAHDLWGKCSRHGQAMSVFTNAGTLSVNGNEKRVISPRVLVPLRDAHDGHAQRRAFIECKEAESILHGFIDSPALSGLEVIILADAFAVLLYHVVQPDLHPVPIPCGFITEDKQMVRRIEAALEERLAEYTEGNVPRYQGPLSPAKGVRKR